MDEVHIVHGTDGREMTGCDLKVTEKSLGKQLVRSIFSNSRLLPLQVFWFKSLLTKIMPHNIILDRSSPISI